MFKLNKVILCIADFNDASKCKWNPKETINDDLEVFGKLFINTILQSHKRNHTVFQNEKGERGLKTCLRSKSF